MGFVLIYLFTYLRDDILEVPLNDIVFGSSIFRNECSTFGRIPTCSSDLPPNCHGDRMTIFFLNVSFNFRWLFYRNLSFVYYAFIFWMILIKYKVLIKMFYNNSFNITEVIILKIWMFFKRVWLVMFYLLNDFEIWSLVKLSFIRYRLL